MLSTSTPRSVHSRAPAATAPLPRDGQPPAAAAAAALGTVESAKMKLSMVSIEKGGVVHIAVDGQITSADVDPTQKNPFEILLGATWATNRVLLNMQNAPYVDSSAIGWMMNSHRGFRDAGGKLVMFNLQPAVRQLLDVLKLGRVLAIAGDEQDARAALTHEDGGAR